MTTAQAGDVVQLVGRDHKHFILRLTPGQQLHTHRGIFEHDALIGRTLGTEVFTHRGDAFFLLQPSTDDLIREIKRSSQIIYPKDIGFILMKLSVRPGVTVVEAGTGSGGLTTVLAQAVGPTGRVISYEVREDMQNLARKNLERVGLADRITFKLRDIAEGFDETDVYALFLDVPNPWDYTGQAYRALQSGGFFGSLVPTANQSPNCWFPCAVRDSISSKCARCSCVTTNPCRTGCGPLIAWWRTPASSSLAVR
jgi:tRNA (adenine57-N1/adenine58-N1)-methyltransferase